MPMLKLVLMAFFYSRSGAKNVDQKNCSGNIPACKCHDDGRIAIRQRRCRFKCITRKLRAKTVF